MSILKSTIRAYCVTLAVFLALITGVWLAAGAKRVERLLTGSKQVNNDLPQSTVDEIEGYLEEKGGE